MTRLDADSDVTEESAVRCDGPRALLLDFREVPLGGVRAMEVHRALPQRDLPMVGAWCFLDRFGPQAARMRVEPHPHIGLQTVTWPFTGDVRHRDSIGSDVVVRPGALNIMTSGEGISHSEYSIGEDAVDLDALQLWVALPESRRHGPPAFEQHEKLPSVPLHSGATAGGGAGAATVVLGEFAGVSSPATAYTPIVGAEIRIAPGARVVLGLRTEWEYALVGVTGMVRVAAAGTRDAVTDAPGTDTDLPLELDREHLLYLGTHRDEIELTSIGADERGAMVFLIGGEPFEDEIVMWWNFVGRSHDEIVTARDAWEGRDARFGHVTGHADERIPAPPLPAVRLTRRRRRL